MNGVLQGDGTKDNPYLVEDVQDFYEVFNRKSSEGNPMYAEQIQDIDFNILYSNGANSIYNDKYQFNEIHYDGKHYKIKNIKLYNKKYFIKWRGFLYLNNTEFINLDINTNNNFEFIRYMDSGNLESYVINCYFHGKIICNEFYGITCGYTGNSTYMCNCMIGCLIELNIQATSSAYIISYSYMGDTIIADTIVRCTVALAINKGSSNLVTCIRTDSYKMFRCLIDTEYINVNGEYIYYLGTSNQYEFNTNIINHEKGKKLYVNLDNKNLLTNEQCRDLSYYEALGWWV